ncbi:restriction endonuclease subunit S [Lactobacillus amylovorus subsp. animalium]|uniref:restriction endonuclease subunit S n=1 Tax=Lactobacillus amylovorus TaxID=1604 RepID=UPI001473A1FB|nr:restriction endonuclease subunit S [Lactobacillus amylovorus]NME30404.1 restriction endonuclease subunit S [Lactobacillus amylovorus]
MKTNTLDFDAQALRDRILDLAMRGKLVPQDPNDEPASVLLEKIKAEKAELVKEKKIKKSKPLPEITDDEKPFDIPDSWEWVRLGDVFDITSSKRVMKKEWKDSGIPFYRAREIVSIKRNRPLKDPIYIDKKTYSEKIKVSGKPRKNDILLTGVGTLGIPYIVPKDKEFYFKDGNIIWLKNFGKVNSNFISYYVQSPYMLKMINNGRGTTVATLTIIRSEKLLVPLPPLSEQSRIAAKIAQLFALLRKVESSTQQYAELQTLLKSKVLDLAMRGKLVKQDPNDEPASELLKKIKAEKAELIKEKKIKESKPLPPITDEEKPFDIPDSWEWVRLGDLTAPVEYAMADGPFGSNLKKTDYTLDPEVRIIQLSNIGENGWKDQNVKYTTFEHLKSIQRSEVFPGNIVIAKMMPAGRAIIVPNKDKKYVLSSDAVKFIPDTHIYKDFLIYAINSNTYRDQVNEKLQGTTRPRTSLKKLKNFLIPLPPFDEQKRIVTKTFDLFNMIG